ncbi:L-xylulose reductase [Orchesella cincta]|uniref:L-xylulose reductase n=1 Tax=Orchesella cincta TaxID=48709 RepID=A0A1D2MG00_ORCCI|nr:L-xylulose reductase [Orchesella cincta]
MHYSFKGKKVLVTGAGQGIGKDIAKTLFEEGATVYALSRTAENLKKLENECPGITTILCDLGDWKATEKALENLETLDYLVNNAGIALKQKLSESTEETFDLMFNVNVKSFINVTKIVTNKMIAEGKKGAVVNVSSVGGLKAGPELMIYNCTKASVEMLTKSMAKQLAPHNIRVNSINPTVVLTGMGIELWNKVAEDYRKTLPLQQFPKTEHCTNAVLFLLSDLSEMTTGSYLPVDAGDLLN